MSKENASRISALILVFVAVSGVCLSIYAAFSGSIGKTLITLPESLRFDGLSVEQTFMMRQHV